MKQLFTILIFTIAAANAFAQSKVSNTSYVTSTGKKVLRLEVTVPVDKATAWTYFSTDDKLSKWIAPVAHIELKTGGFLRTNYDAKKTLADPSSIQLGVVNYLEKELLTLKVKLNGTFPAQAQATDQNLQELIQFVDEGNGHTRIISSMIGWGQGPEWDKTYQFFDRGNTWTFEQLLKLFP